MGQRTLGAEESRMEGELVEARWEAYACAHAYGMERLKGVGRRIPRRKKQIDSKRRDWP